MGNEVVVVAVDDDDAAVVVVAAACVDVVGFDGDTNDVTADFGSSHATRSSFEFLQISLL